MNPGEWIALMSLFVVILLAVVGAAVYNVRENGKLRALILEVVHRHEIECVNHEPNTAVQLRALSGD
jgi:hypothetical protein